MYLVSFCSNLVNDSKKMFSQFFFLLIKFDFGGCSRDAVYLKFVWWSNWLIDIHQRTIKKSYTSADSISTHDDADERWKKKRSEQNIQQLISFFVCYQNKTNGCQNNAWIFSNRGRHLFFFFFCLPFCLHVVLLLTVKNFLRWNFSHLFE